jgi:hypothetical protein
MRVSSIGKDHQQPRSVSQPTQSGADNFSQILETTVTHTTRPTTPAQETSAQQGTRSSLITIGTISARTPTVSHLLRNHPAWNKTAWRVIHAEVNRDKPFTKIRPGTTVYIDVETQELGWDHDARRAKPSQPAAEVPAQPIRLGIIAPRTPTVSHLLSQHPESSKEVWNIVFAASNRHKDFTHMRPGTTVFLHPETREISWHEESIRQRTQPHAAETPASVQADQHEDDDARHALSAELAHAVKPLYGTSYKNIDCYELLVQGLKELGVRYQGTGGLRDQLVHMAVAKGLPENTYLTGEGLIEASGSRVYTRRIGTMHQPDTHAQQVFQEMEPLLEEGLILAFSTRTRGHTGILSNNNGMWTFINSGVMDHPVSPRTSERGVGEEILREEITNWLLLAANRRESLHITLGRLEVEKLRTTVRP